MPSLPNKSIKGAAFKKWVVESIDKLIDYLSSTYIQVGQGLKIRRSPSGLVIELEKQPGEPQSATGGGGGVAQDITTSVTGNTASIGLSGSTATAQLVGAGDVQVSGGTNGEIILTGSGYPVWGALSFQQITPTWSSGTDEMTPYVLQYSGFLYITVTPTMEFDPDVSAQDIYCYVSIDNKQVFAFQRDVVFESFQGGDVPHYRIYSQDSGVIPVCAGSTVTARYYDSSGATQKLSLSLYHI